jgi:uncharacterized DUF497 family protein
MGMIGTRLHFVVFTQRKGRIRLISLRKANEKEQMYYGTQVGL